MNYKLVTQEQYATINFQETAFDASISTEFEEIARDLFRQSYRNIIVDLSITRSLDVACEYSKYS